MHLKTLALTGAATLFVLPPQHAEACEPPFCASPVRVFKEGLSVPGNQVYFAILADPPGPLSLHVVGGAEIPASIQTIAGEQVFAPDAPIPAGTEVELRYSDTCRDGQRAERQFRFSTYDAAPATDFRIELIPYFKGVRFTPDGTDVYAARQAFRISLQGEDASAAFHLGDYAATIDGQPLEITQVDGAPVVQVDSICERGSEDEIDSCGVLWHVASGTRTLKLTTRTVGTETKPSPIELDFQIGWKRRVPGGRWQNLTQV